MRTDVIVHPRLRGHRLFNTTAPLGKIMAERGIRVVDMQEMSGVSYRTLCEYLARRREFKPEHLVVIADALGVAPDVLTAYQPADIDPDGASSEVAEEARTHRPMPSAGAFLAALKGA